MTQVPKYCPICGHELAEREEGGRVRPACDECGYVHYVNPVPGVGLVIEKDGGVILIQRGQPPHQGAWTLPSGFVEADESAEEAAIREAEEETGLKVEIIEMAGVNSFPEGPPVSGIMIFYRLRPIGGELRAGDDAAAARVFQPEEIPLLPFRTHREMMAEWLQKTTGSRNAARQQAATPAFIIRRARPEDWQQVSGLLQLIPANRNVSSAEWGDTERRFRESDTVEVYVAQSTEPTPMIIGCVALSVVRALTEGRGFINDMAVLPTHRRHGVGAELLEAVLRRAHELNLRSLMVNTNRGNDPARAFYAALGFTEEHVMRLKIR